MRNDISSRDGTFKTLPRVTCAKAFNYVQKNSAKGGAENSDYEKKKEMGR